jgi:hypothetical protein
MRDVAALQRQATSHSEAIGRYAAALLDSPLPWTRKRRFYALLGLATVTAPPASPRSAQQRWRLTCWMSDGCNDARTRVDDHARVHALGAHHSARAPPPARNSICAAAAAGRALV